MPLSIVYRWVKHVTRNPTYRNDATCRILVSEDIVLPPFCQMVEKGELVGVTSMANGLLDPCSEKLAQSGVVIARFLVDLQQNSEPLRVGDITNEKVT